MRPTKLVNVQGLANLLVESNCKILGINTILEILSEKNLQEPSQISKEKNPQEPSQISDEKNPHEPSSISHLAPLP